MHQNGSELSELSEWIGTIRVHQNGSELSEWIGTIRVHQNGSELSEWIGTIRVHQNGSELSEVSEVSEVSSRFDTTDAQIVRPYRATSGCIPTGRRIPLPSNF